MEGYIYILTNPEMERGILKIGQTGQDPSRRLRGYPAGSNFIKTFYCSDRFDAEKNLISHFQSNFTLVKPFREYFRGDGEKMIHEFDVICNETPCPMETD